MWVCSWERADRELQAHCSNVLCFRRFSPCPPSSGACAQHISVANLEPATETLLGFCCAIKFVKMEYGKNKRSLKVTPYDPRPAQLRKTSDEEIQSLRRSLEIKGNVALLHVLPTTGAVTSSAHVPRLPPIPRSSIERIQYQVKKSTQLLSLGDIFSFSKQLVDRLTLAPASYG